MNLALIGAGRTGGHIQKLVQERKEWNLLDSYTSQNPVNYQTIAEHADGVVVFVPPSIAPSLISPLLETGKPVVWGTTGFHWPNDLDQKLKQDNIRWIYGSNFSLGMALVKNLIKTMKFADTLMDNIQWRIHEEHHTAKVDAPSGTALLWRGWLGRDSQISYERKGDVKGFHQLTLENEQEKITLSHEAKDRSLFASGALFALKYLITNQNQNNGLIPFEQITDELLNEVIYAKH